MASPLGLRHAFWNQLRGIFYDAGVWSSIIRGRRVFFFFARYWWLLTILVLHLEERILSITGLVPAFTTVRLVLCQGPHFGSLETRTRCLSKEI